MRLFSFPALGLFAFSSVASAEELSHFQRLFDERGVETRNLTVTMNPVGEDVDFLVTLRNNETGFERAHRFEGEGANDPTPFQLEYMSYCDTPVILLTVEYPWRHALPEFVRVLDTFAFRETDFAFIDVAFGPLTDIALADDTAYDSTDLAMLPPIRVRCLAGQDEKPFEFFQQETK